MAAVFFGPVFRIQESAAEAPEAESPAFKCRNMSYIPGFGFQKTPPSFKILYTQTPWITHLSLKTPPAPGRIETVIAEPDFFNDQKKASEIMREHRRLKELMETWDF